MSQGVSLNFVSWNSRGLQQLKKVKQVMNKFVTNDRSEARVDPLAALLVQGQTGKYQAVVSRAT